MIIEINALDTLFFRDGKPFNMGEEVWADGIFPPPPSVIYGALRTAYFAEHGGIKKANTPQDPTKDLEIKGIYYYFKNDYYLPIPLDCVREKDSDEDKKEALLLPLKKNKDYFFSNFPLRNILVKDNKKVENIDHGFVQASTYLSGGSNIIFYEKLEDFILREPKIGIARDNSSHSSDEGRIYRVGMQRLSSKMKKGKINKFSIIVAFNWDDTKPFPEKGFLKLGGEGKSVYYEKIKYEDEAEIEKPNIKGDHFKLCLSTHAFFENGWLPKWIDPESFKGKMKYKVKYKEKDEHGNEIEKEIEKEIEVELLTACIGKPISIGGFDMKARKPKAMRKAVPAGSVYYFKTEKDKIQEVIDHFHPISISDCEEDRKQGFGICYVGGI